MVSHSHQSINLMRTTEQKMVDSASIDVVRWDHLAAGELVHVAWFFLPDFSNQRLDLWHGYLCSIEENECSL